MKPTPSRSEGVLALLALLALVEVAAAVCPASPISGFAVYPEHCIGTQAPSCGSPLYTNSCGTVLLRHLRPVVTHPPPLSYTQCILTSPQCVVIVYPNHRHVSVFSCLDADCGRSSLDDVDDCVMSASKRCAADKDCHSFAVLAGGPNCTDTPPLSRRWHAYAKGSGTSITRRFRWQPLLLPCRDSARCAAGVAVASLTSLRRCLSKVQSIHYTSNHLTSPTPATTYHPLHQQPLNIHYTSNHLPSRHCKMLLQILRGTVARYCRIICTMGAPFTPGQEEGCAVYTILHHATCTTHRIHAIRITHHTPSPRRTGSVVANPEWIAYAQYSKPPPPAPPSVSSAMRCGVRKQVKPRMLSHVIFNIPKLRVAFVERLSVGE